MDLIKGFRNVTYNDLQKELNRTFQRSGKSLPELAVSADLTSTAGVKNAFEYDEQKVSDKTLTSILGTVGLEAMVIWVNGERKYFISTKVNV